MINPRNNCAIFLVVVFCSTVVFSQEKAKVDDAPLSYWTIRKKLVFRSPVRETDAEISAKIVTEVAARNVDFVITPEEEKSLAEIGATNELIVSIRNRVPKEKRVQTAQVREATLLYQRYVDHYARADLNSRRKAIEAGKEFIRLFCGDPEFKEQCDYFNLAVPKLEKWIEMMNQVNHKKTRFRGPFLQHQTIGANEEEFN